MNRWKIISLPLAVAAVAVAGSMVGTGWSWAAEDDSQGGATIERYTGEPIFLEEPETPPPASLVEKRVDSDKYPDGKVRYERQIARYSDDHFVADGFHREFYPNGQKFVEGQYNDGHREGKWSYWYDNGQLQRTVTYKKGQPDGSWDVHNLDGAVVAKRGFKSGKRDGTWVIYDETGKQPLREEVYTDGKANGTWKVWFPSGQQQTEVSIKDGVRNGPYVEWSEKGTKLKDLTFVDGKLDGTATLWGEDGRKVVLEYDHGKLLKQSRE